MKRKTFFLITLALVICAIAAVCIYTFVDYRRQRDNFSEINLYYYNGTDNTLGVEKRSVPRTDNTLELVGMTYTAYVEGPKTPGLVYPFKEDTAFQVLNEDSSFTGVLDIDISGSFDNLKETERLIAIGALVYTFTDIPGVDSVSLTVNGESVSELYGITQVLNRDNTVNNPVINPEKIDRQLVVLYFLNEKGTALVSEERSIEVKQSQTSEYQIVEQLIMGPADDSLKAAVPQGTKIKDIKTEDGTCYVNLSNDFVNSLSGDMKAERLTIYSIVNSLTELNTVNKVQFLIEGERLSELKGHYDFSRTFERDEELIEDN